MGALVSAAFGNGEDFVGVGSMLMNIVTEPNLAVGLTAIFGRAAVKKLGA